MSFIHKTTLLLSAFFTDVNPDVYASKEIQHIIFSYHSLDRTCDPQKISPLEGQKMMANINIGRIIAMSNDFQRHEVDKFSCELS